MVHEQYDQALAKSSRGCFRFNMLSMSASPGLIVGLLVIFCTYKCNFFTVEVLDSCLCMLALKLPYWW